jgi:hypothetical protein
MLMRCEKKTQGDGRERVKEKPFGVKTPSVLTCGPAAINYRRSEDIQSSIYIFISFSFPPFRLLTSFSRI